MPQTMTLVSSRCGTTTRSGRRGASSAFTDDMIRAAVHTGEFSDPEAEKYLADVLIKRRDKIAQSLLTAVNPIVDPRARREWPADVRERGSRRQCRAGASAYRASWAQFDNTTGQSRPIAETQSETTTIQAPDGLPAAPGSFIEVSISAESQQHPAWRQPIRTHFRRDATGWKLVGLERMPAAAPGAAAQRTSR